MSVSVLEVSNADTSATTNNLNKSKAFYVTTAGLEWAKHNIINGNDPTVVNKRFDIRDAKLGTFTVAMDSTTKTVTVIGKVADARSNQKTTIMASDCIVIDEDDQSKWQFNNYPTYSMGGIFDTRLKNKCSATIGTFTLDQIEITSGLSIGHALSQVSLSGTIIYTRPPYGSVGIAYSSQHVNVTDTDITGTHVFDSIFIAWNAPTADPVAGSTSWNVKYIFTDGSSLEKTYTY